MNNRKALILFSILLIIPAFLFNLNPEKFPADDGFFYPQIAYNIAQGHGSTFNNIYDTNGYHPLWMLVCTFLAVINIFSKDGLLHLIWFVQFCLFIASIFLLSSVFKRSNSSELNFELFTFGAALLSIPFIGLGTLYLNEAHLNLFFLSLSIYLILKNENISINKAIIIGIAFGLTILARLDNIFVVACLSVWWIYSKRIFHIKLLSVFIMSLTLPVIIYLAWNYIEFDNIIPISGYIKSTFPAIAFEGLDLWGKILALFTISYLLCLFTFLKGEAHRNIMAVFCIGNLLHIFYNFTFQHGIGQWYWVGQYLCLAMYLSDILFYIQAKYKFTGFFESKLSIIMLFILVLPILILSYLRLNYNFSLEKLIVKKGGGLKIQREDYVRQFANRLNSVLKPGSAILVYDTPGRLAFYSKMKIVPTDGLVNNFDFLAQTESLSFSEFLRFNKINYIITPYSYDENFDYSRLSLSVNKVRNNFIIELRSPKSQRACGKIQPDGRNIIFIEKNPLKTWQPFYDWVALWKVE